MMSETRFDSLREAIKQGWEVYDRTSTGYIMRKRTDKGWVLARCDVKQTEYISPPCAVDDQC